MSIAWKVEATPIPIMPSWLVLLSTFTVVLSSSDVCSNEEFSIITKHLTNKREKIVDFPVALFHFKIFLSNNNVDSARYNGLILKYK